MAQVIFFDVFGTTVEWRFCVTNALYGAAQRILQDEYRYIPQALHTKVSSMTYADWQEITEAWRRSYYQFTRTAQSNPSQTFTSVDEHHHAALLSLLQSHELTGLFSELEIHDLVDRWHRLEPWSDAVLGLRLLNRRFRTCTLSNGNIALLEDLVQYGSLPFAATLSAEHFGAYKPSPTVYHGAAERFGLRPEECVLVAAHLWDLKAAKACGFQTVFVERWKEESSDLEQARREGYVDVWVDASAEGFIEVARRFGIEL